MNKEQTIDVLESYCERHFDWILEDVEDTPSGTMLYFDGGILRRNDLYKLEIMLDDLYRGNYEVDNYAGRIILM